MSAGEGCRGCLPMILSGTAKHRISLEQMLILQITKAIKNRCSASLYPDTELCSALVAEIIVESNDTLRFRLHNGLELRESIERTVR